jgi:eukaryotic-like serine/threonine-protein kinase
MQLACNFSVSRGFPAVSCRTVAYGRRTRHSVDSLDTLVAPARSPASSPAPNSASTVSEGSLLHDRYRLLERLGAGGFGVVWRAEDELLHREVALKRIPLPPEPSPPAGEPQKDLAERARREALAAARLGHPAIVALYEAYVEDDAFYLVSELVHGETLAQLIASGELTDEQTLEIGFALANALDHAHARGVIHRDVKPQNVLVRDTPAERETPVKLTDFGGARLSGEDGLTRTGETLGTLAYMAPEQSEGHDADEQADVYSLALVLYEALTGGNPVRGPTPAATARRIGRPIPPLGTIRPELSPALSQAVDAALTSDPRRRATLPELHAALEDALEEGPVSPRRGLLRARSGRRAANRRRGSSNTAESATCISPARPVPARPVPAHVVTATGPPPVRAPAPDPLAEAPKRGLLARLALPRGLWLGCALALAIWEAARGRPGLALVVLALAAPLLLMGPRPDVGWLAGALAPALGLVGLAGAYPALAGQAGRWTRRAALATVGYWWLTLSAPLLAGSSPGARLWLAPASSMPPRAAWEGSLDTSLTHVLVPALTLGLLLGAALWALAAAVLPLIVRGHNAVLDALVAVVWSATLFAATPSFDSGLAAHASLAHPRGALPGAILGAAIAIAARALRGPI